MKADLEILVFTVAGQRLGLPMQNVIRAVRAVEVTRLRQTPSLTLGVIDVSGELLPVFSVRQRLGLADSHEIKLSDHFIIARASHRDLVLAVEEVHGVTMCERPALAPAEEIASELDRFGGVLRLPDGLIVVFDLEKFLTPSEEASLKTALAELGEDDIWSDPNITILHKA